MDNINRTISRQSNKLVRTRFILVHMIILSVLGVYLSVGVADARAIKLTQNFQPGSAEAFERALTSDIDTVILDVTGGYLNEGLKIGRIIRDRKLRVLVPEHASCLSACAEAFLGGIGYKIDGVVAFHIPRVEKLSSRKQAFELGLAGGTLTAIYRHDMGFSFGLTETINRWTTANRLIVFKSVEELNFYASGSPAENRPLPVFLNYRN